MSFHFFAVLSWFAFCLASTVAVAQAPYPSKPIRIIAAFAPGSTLDVMARILGPRLAESLGQPVIVENRPGAGGMIGMDATAKAAPDGHTLAIGALGPNATNPALYRKTPFDPVKDLTGVTLLATGPVAIVTHPSVPARTVRELVALAQARPGQVSYGTPGVGTSPHLAGELFQSVTGTKMLHVPYVSPGAATADTMANRTQLIFHLVPAVAQQALAGNVRALAVLAPSRADDTRYIEQMANLGRSAISPGAVAHYYRQTVLADLRDLLADVQAPTLVLQRARGPIVSTGMGRYVADHIPRARYVEIAGTDHMWFTEHGDEVVDEIEEFLTGTRTSADADRS